ncbi:hypothetical protein CLU96_3063 [Chryseobacterium sp. 52]|uniref:hypothetical protein n=1 Tax=Chryseobacterium sp. 52 TaxID=2035213 RepID=UPI000C179DA1|nr:hypothetical protein [Chryseobacterium sp. 52]PIF46045.1 hypothetical protein CLU96_3063 [Chryseobacterium sp. 52]
MKKEILKQLRSDYERLEIKPSADLWDRIEQETDSTPVLSLKKPFQWWKYAAVLLLLISVGTIVYFNGDLKKKTTEQIVQKKPAVKELPTENSSAPDQNIKTIQENNIADVSFPDSSEKLQAVEIQERMVGKVIKKEDRISVQEEKDPINHQEIKTIGVEKVIDQSPEKAKIAENKQVNYINADELLQGREFDKTRQESQNEHKRFGVLDMTKIKIKSPNSFKIFGMTVYSDSVETN